MTVSFQQWLSDVNGKAVNVEPGLGPQCYGLVANYIQQVIGGPSPSTQAGDHPGFVIGTFDGYNTNGLSQYFDKLPANATPQPGDIAFWGWGMPYTPESHGAVVAGTVNGKPVFASQNSPTQENGFDNLTHVVTLPTQGIVGYFRPKGETGSSDANTNSSGSTELAGSNSGTGNPLIDMIVNALKGGNQLNNLATNLFLPSTYIRIVSGVIGVILIGFGLYFIVKDYNRHEG